MIQVYGMELKLKRISFLLTRTSNIVADKFLGSSPTQDRCVADNVVFFCKAMIMYVPLVDMLELLFA